MSASTGLPRCDRQQVARCTESRGLFLDEPCCGQDGLAPGLVGPPFGQVGDKETGALDVEDAGIGETGLTYLVGQLMWVMEVSGGEQAGIRAAEHPCLDAGRDRGEDVRLVKAIDADEEVEQGGEARDRCGEEQPSVAEHPAASESARTRSFRSTRW